MKYLLTLFLAIGLSTSGSAQESSAFAIDRFYFGGNFGFGASSGTGYSSTYLNISPIVGYKFTDRIIAGPGFIYQSFVTKVKSPSFTIRSQDYGWKLFGRYFILENIFAHVEPEWLSMEYWDGSIDASNKPVTNRINVFSMFVGGGYRQMIGENTGIDLLFLYNINDNIYSPYSNPILRLGFGLGF